MEKYFSTVAALGFAVSFETTNISSAETSTIGTTGMKPKTLVPEGVRAKTSVPPTDQKTAGGPGGGAGIVCWKTATAVTAKATQTVEASAPHFVEPRQKSAAIIKGDSAAKPENAYWMAISKIVSGARSATT